MLVIFLLSFVSAEPGDLASVLKTEGARIVDSIEELSQRCDQSQNNAEILTAVHTSLHLQRRVTQLEEQISNLEYLLSDLLPGKARRDISVQSQDTDVHFNVVRSEVRSAVLPLS